MHGLSEEFVGDSFLLGDIDSTTKRLMDYAQAGASHIVLGCPPGDHDDLAEFMQGITSLRAEIFR